MSEKKRNKLILGFLFLFWGIILFVFIKKIYTFWENKISFRMEESTDSLPEIIKSSLERMEKRWHISNQCIIFQESIRLNEYGELEKLSIKLMDRDYISYSINLSRYSKDKKKVFGTVYREGI